MNSVLLLSLGACSAPAPNPSPTPALTTFTDSQAARGQGWFDATCLRCHEVYEVSSEDFRFRWGGQTAFDLYELISTTMPEDDPGALSRRAYTDIVTYLMRINGVPAGNLPLTADSLALANVRLTFRSHSLDPR